MGWLLALSILRSGRGRALTARAYMLVTSYRVLADSTYSGL